MEKIDHRFLAWALFIYLFRKITGVVTESNAAVCTYIYYIYLFNSQHSILNTQHSSQLAAGNTCNVQNVQRTFRRFKLEMCRLGISLKWLRYDAATKDATFKLQTYHNAFTIVVTKRSWFTIWRQLFVRWLLKQLKKRSAPENRVSTCLLKLISWLERNAKKKNRKQKKSHLKLLVAHLYCIYFSIAIDKAKSTLFLISDDSQEQNIGKMEFVTKRTCDSLARLIDDIW